ncbi:MAG: transposase [Puniceicoccales bacterium]|nr:transposase [Puniceicoccales bacterium]
MLLCEARSKSKRQEFKGFIAKERVKDLVFVDESGINHQDIKKYAWSEKGVRVIGERSGAAHHRRTTVIAGICWRKIPRFTSMITRIPTISELWLEKVLCPKLKPGRCPFLLALYES